MLKKGVTLRGIEVFEALAKSGSVAQTAIATGLSQPAVSQQMRNLETALATELIDHARRPMRLTPAGHVFLRRAEAALTQLRQAQSEVTVMDLAHLDELNLGIIDDFDDDLTPRLATLLADSMTGCRFRMITSASRTLLEAVHDRALHMAISARDVHDLKDVTEYPLARDPFIMVAPHSADPQAQAHLAGASGLPFLRYSDDQLIASQIDRHLATLDTPPPARFEIGSHLALMAMVARGIGWAITTPLGYMRAARFHDTLQAMPLPFADAARHISLFAANDWSGPVPRDIARTMGQLIDTHVITPAVADLPWLAGSLKPLHDVADSQIGNT